MTLLSTRPAAGKVDDATLQEIEQRALWLSTAMINHANRGRPNPTGSKVGGHQASSASAVTLMTYLWLEQLQAVDRVAVKPHASPVLHALEFLLGQLDKSYLERLREFGGLQSYPSRLKDPVAADYSTGSVGIGATAPIWGAIARRYIDTHFGAGGSGRQYALLGDAELDEGATWEAVSDPMVGGLGELVWVVDLNRQSLDRIVPAAGPSRLQGMFAAAGWQVLTVKYGKRLEELCSRTNGELLRERLDAMTNAEYQHLLRQEVAALRALLPGASAAAPSIARLLNDLDDAELGAAVRDLGGHDFTALRQAFDAIDDDRPTVVFAYTIKGYGLPMAAHPHNHSAMLSQIQLEELADRVGLRATDPWQAFAPGTAAARACAEAAERLDRGTAPVASALEVPEDLDWTPTGRTTTQAALGRTLFDLHRNSPSAGSRVVTVSPDVSSTTNLAGWINKVGVWSPESRRDWFADDADTLLHWQELPQGQHIELGIAETNLVGLIAELGSTWSRWGEPLLPIGVLYDTFVGRALEPWSFGIYSGGQSLLIGTPSGVTLAAEGGAHQSVTTPSIGVEQPGCTSWEPGFALDAAWCLLAALALVGRPGGGSAYVRLSTRAVDQRLAAVPADPHEREARRRLAVAGGYPLVTHPHARVTIVAGGAVITEALDAANLLGSAGLAADVTCVTSADLLFRAMQARDRGDLAAASLLDELFPRERALPLVTVLDGHPHTLAFLAGANGVPATHLGVSDFGQSGDLHSIYRHFGLDSNSIVEAALRLIG